MIYEATITDPKKQLEYYKEVFPRIMSRKLEYESAVESIREYIDGIVQFLDEDILSVRSVLNYIRDMLPED